MLLTHHLMRETHQLMREAHQLMRVMRLETSDLRIHVQNMHQSRHAAGTEQCAGVYHWKDRTGRVKAVWRIGDGQGYWRAVAKNVRLESTIGKTLGFVLQRLVHRPTVDVDAGAIEDV